MCRRRELRIHGFDYSTAGLYFVTSCTFDRACIFGVVVEGTVLLSRFGVAARDCLAAIPDHHGGVVVDASVVMPNHVHAILALDGRATLGAVLGTYKAGLSRLTGHRRFWQRGYHDHVIRDEPDLARIREYIEHPLRWTLDPENPS
ncbi:MAG: transposase [Actinobacteria bacterium]|nr:transposase [Actinomycetota bacterium]